ncbi:hypothetical protein N172_13895 [Pantoea dispersa EGD-AAK13]|nr:hypothetical protein N172_13895 [Pantoea dispersa EGD-AAK13]
MYRTMPIGKELHDELKDKEGEFFAEYYRQFYRVIRLTRIELPEGFMSHIPRHRFTSHFIMTCGIPLELQRIFEH